MMDLSPLANRDNWAIASSIATTFSIFFLVIGPRLEVVRNWVGAGLQEMLGVTALRHDMSKMHEDNQSRLTTLESEVDDLKRKVES